MDGGGATIEWGRRAERGVAHVSNAVAGVGSGEDSGPDKPDAKRGSTACCAAGCAGQGRRRRGWSVLGLLPWTGRRSRQQSMAAGHAWKQARVGAAPAWTLLPWALQAR